jgi:hypothetical protein
MRWICIDHVCDLFIREGLIMSSLIEKAMRQAAAARPASGFQPETPEEWKRVRDAFEYLAYATYREAGMSHHKAKQLASITHGGKAGKLLLATAFEGKDNE